MLLCLLNMPYSFFMFVRTIATISFIVLAIQEKESKTGNYAVIFIILAVIFQPIIKIPFGRTVWNIIDIVVAVGLLANVLKERTDEKGKSN